MTLATRALHVLVLFADAPEALRAWTEAVRLGGTLSDGAADRTRAAN